MRLLSRARGACRRLFYFFKLYGQHLPLGIKLIFKMPCSVILLRGTMKGSDDPLALLYVGRYGNYHYLQKNLFEECDVVEERKTTLLTFRRHMDRMEAASDVAIVDIGWPYHGLMNRSGVYLEMPDWAGMALELGETWEDTIRLFRHTTRRQDLRHIRLNEYRCEPTNDRAAIEKFYDEMYLPFIESRHGLDAVKASRRHVVRRAGKGCLLQIFKGERVVVAGVVYPEDGALYFLWLGMPSDCIEKPPQAAISAVYYFGIKHALDQGLWAVDFTGTRTFLSDGVFRFKRKWGALVEDSFSPSSLLVRPKNGHLNAARFCQRFPMLVRRNGELEGLLLSVDAPLDDKRLSQLNALYGCNGISRMTVVDLSGHGKAGCRDVAVGDLEFRLIGAGLDHYADHYAKHAVRDSGL